MSKTLTLLQQSSFLVYVCTVIVCKWEGFFFSDSHLLLFTENYVKKCKLVKEKTVFYIERLKKSGLIWLYRETLVLPYICKLMVPWFDLVWFACDKWSACSIIMNAMWGGYSANSAQQPSTHHLHCGAT